MTELSRNAFSYRDDRAVPRFDDSRPLFVFDGTCVLCSTGASWIMRRDKEGEIAFASAEGKLGQALYRHYELALDDSYLFLADGRAFGLSEGYFEVARRLGGIWRLSAILRVVPRAFRDWIYRVIARNRYRWFGRAESCTFLTPEQRERLLN